MGRANVAETVLRADKRFGGMTANGAQRRMRRAERWIRRNGDAASAPSHVRECVYLLETGKDATLVAIQRWPAKPPNKDAVEIMQSKFPRVMQ